MRALTAFGSTLEDVLNVAAVVTLIAGFFVVARYRAALEATESAATAWRAERDASVEKATRVERELSEARAEISVLRQHDATAVLTALSIQERHSQETARAMEKILQLLTAQQEGKR